MSRIENNPSFGLIRQEGDRIVQYGLTVEPLVMLSVEYDLVLKKEADNEWFKY